MTDASEHDTFLPRFVDHDWLEEHLVLTAQDRRTVSEALAERYPDWPVGKVSQEGFVDAYIEEAEQDPYFPILVERIVSDKTSRSKAWKKGVSGGVRTKIGKRLDSFETPSSGWTSAAVRDALEEADEHRLLAEAVWVDLMQMVDFEDAMERANRVRLVAYLLAPYLDAMLQFADELRTAIKSASEGDQGGQDDRASDGDPEVADGAAAEGDAAPAGSPADDGGRAQAPDDDPEAAWRAALDDIRADLAEAGETPDTEIADRIAAASERLRSAAAAERERARAERVERARQRADDLADRAERARNAVPARKALGGLAAALSDTAAAARAAGGLDPEAADEIADLVDAASDHAARVGEAARESAAAARAYGEAESDDEAAEQRLDDARTRLRELEAGASDPADALRAATARLLPGAPAPAGGDADGPAPDAGAPRATGDFGSEAETSDGEPARAETDAPSDAGDAPPSDAAPEPAGAAAEPAQSEAPPSKEPPADAAPAEAPATPEAAVPDTGAAGPEAKDSEAPDAGTGEPEADPTGDEVVAAFAETVGREEFSLAHHLAVCAERLGVAERRMPIPEATEIFDTGRAVRGSGGQAALHCWSLYQRLADRIASVDTATETGLASVAFVFAGALRPALFAPDSGARQLLEDLPIGPELQFLHPLREVVNDLERRGFYTTAARMRGAGDAGPAQEACDRALADLETWIEQTRQSNTVYAPATKVWRTLVSPDGRIGVVAEAVRRGESGARSKAGELVRELSDGEAVDRLIHATDAELRPEVAGKPIEARAMNKLRANAEVAADRIGAWVEAASSLEGQDADRGDQKNHERLHAAIAEANEHAGGLRASGSPVAAAAGDALSRVFGTLLGLLDGEEDRAPLTHQFALHGDLLKLPGLRYIGGWAPAPYEPNTILSAILEAAREEPASWVDAFRERAQEANHLATARLVEIVERMPGTDAETAATLRREREQAVVQARQRLRERRDRLRRDLDRAMRLDQSEDMQLSDLIDRIDAIDPDALPEEERLRDEDPKAGDVIADFPAAFRLLENAQATVERTSEAARREYERRIRAIETGDPRIAEQAPRLRGLLEQGDLLTLAEYLETVERGSPLPDVADAGDAFDAFFPGFVVEIDREKPALPTIQKAAKQAGAAPGVDFSGLAADRRADAEHVLQLWSGLKKNALRSNPTASLAQLFEAFAFRDVTFEEDKGSKSAGRTRRFTMRAQTLSDQSVCPAPAFGSKAAGHYEVMIYDGRAQVEEVVRDAGGAGGHPRIALILGRLTEAQRRSFARQAHKQRRTVLLIDETLTLFLALHEGDRLSALFAAALPFTWTDPYTTKAGNIPIEIFYGRNDEIEKIRDPEGPSLVFGGRQLGKSALLQHVAKLDHDPDRGHVVRVIECRQIGRSEPTGAIWQRISADLAPLGVVDARVADGQALSERIMAWLDADQRRRLLICLDEMDSFMLQEVEAEYENLVVMKELMQRSDWRCKFVFAGLHDIQRMAKTVNTPLAHLGEPICVGPLYGDDLAAAHRLVTQPMAAAGYRFEDENLPLRILADVLYYPSLVQVYCKQLLEQLRGAQFSEQEGPRYTITADMVERAFAGEELRRALAHRFDLTLRLDQRYRLIALILTQQALEDRNRNVEGYSLEWIRDEALSWWPQGFPSASNDAFGTLLDEMQGLGVLHKRDAGWRLRSTKIASMIGSPERIEQDLLEFEHKEADLPYEPAVYHRGVGNEPLRPSPFTQRQEYDLIDEKVGVSVVLGSPVAGVAEAIPAIESADPPVNLQRLGPTPDERSLGNAIGKAEGRRGVATLLVDHRQPWSPDWVRGALRHPAIRKGRVRLVFVGDSEAALSWTESGLAAEAGRKLRTFHLRPWADQGLKLWLHDVNLDTLDQADERARILRETGGYTDLIRRFGEHLHNIPGDWRARREGWFDEVCRPACTLEALGVLPRLAPFVRALADFGDTRLSREEASELPALYGFDLPTSPDAALAWAETVGFLTPAGRNLWFVNPLLAAVLQRETEDA